MRHLERIFLEEKEDESELTENKHKVVEYMDSKYSDSSIENLLSLCTFLDHYFKFDYIKRTNYMIQKLH